MTMILVTLITINVQKSRWITREQMRARSSAPWRAVDSSVCLSLTDAWRRAGMSQSLSHQEATAQWRGQLKKKNCTEGIVTQACNPSTVKEACRVQDKPEL